MRPVLHDFTGRSAERLAHAYADGARLQAARRRAAPLEPGEVPADGLYDALFAPRTPPVPWQTVFERRRGRAGGGVTLARIQRSDAGAWSISVRPHEQSPEEMAELAEQVHTLVDTETAAAAGVRFGRRLSALLSPEDAKESDRSWLEGCVWAAAHSAGLDWDRLQSAVAAEVLRKQPDGWERAVVKVVGGSDADPAGV